MSTSILVGDCRTELANLPDASVQCCVTSPPYYGLRDYGIDAQIGLERTLPEYIAALVGVFREVRRVLKDDGTLWLNLGDSYATGAGKVGDSPGGGAQGERWKGNRGDRPGSPKHAGPSVGPMTQPNRLPQPGLKPKDLMMVPARVALALQDDGWYLRSDIIWHKRAPMPESVRDRPTGAHEHIFLLSKQPRYFYDADAVAETVADSSVERLSQNVASQEGSHRANGGTKTNGTMRAVGGTATRNMRNVWTLSPEPFPGSHFATMPTEIPRRAISAGCPIGGTVLDPFLGSGTTLLVASRLERNGIGIECNPAYAEMARQRIYNDAPLFADIA